jgi:uncharacterized protein (TIGR02271 family)
MKTVVGLFDSANEAQRMLEELMQMGFQPDDISVVTNLASQSKVEARSIRLDPMNLEDVGRIAAAGPVRDALQRTRGVPLRGVLERSGFPADLADRYAAGVERGGTLESLVVPDSDADRVLAAMKRRNTMGSPTEERRTEERQTEEGRMEELRSSEQREEPIGSRGLETDEELRIPIVREELKVGKRAVQRGAVRVSVRAVERPISEQIHLRETHVEIERRPVDRVAAEGDGFRDQIIELSEEGEEAIASKQARVVEEVVIHKRVTDRTETIRDTLRATQVDYGKMAEGPATEK